MKIQTDDFQFNPKENFRKPNMFIENPCNTLGKPTGKPRFPLKSRRNSWDKQTFCSPLYSFVFLSDAMKLFGGIRVLWIPLESFLNPTESLEISL